MTAHSKLGASSYSRWGACPGSVALSAGLPDVTSAYAEEGTLAHDLAATLLKLEAPSAEMTVGKPFSEEALEAIQVYLDHAENIRALNPSYFAVEQRVSLEAVYPGLFGTADLMAYTAYDKTLYVSDYKHGAGVPVEVAHSKQLLYYGLGALLALKAPVDRIVLTIIQPRCYHKDGPVRSWETDALEILDFAAQLAEDAAATEMPGAPLNPGEHCRWCKAKTFCPALKDQALRAVESAFTNLEESPALPVPAIPMDVLADYLQKIPQIKAWCEAIHSYAHQQAELGNPPPGWKLVDKRAVRRWAPDFDPELAAIELGVEKTDLLDAPKVKSPAQVEKLKGVSKSALELLVIKESSGKTLVPVNDDRPAQAGKIEKMFT